MTLDVQTKKTTVVNFSEFNSDINIKEVIQTKKANYLIEELLGEGGYGTVYCVLNTKDNQRYAMKTEKKQSDKKCPKLKMEVKVLKDLENVKRERSHFVKMYDRCRKKNYFLIVMDLVGKNILDLRNKSSRKIFSESTNFNIAIQCLEALEDLHKFNYIHRDVKPANFAIGIEKNNDIIYVLDFGLARYILNHKKELKTPREKCKFKGTIRYAPLATHKGLDNGKKDDVEAWVYMIAESLLPFGLTWGRTKRITDVYEMKIKSRNVEKFLFPYESSQKFNQFLKYIDTLTYADKVDYMYFYETIKEEAKKHNIDLNQPFDWIKK
ncbi:Protein kinase domain and Serine/threonine-/dual specificity protein kinase, catalytic domain and Protein kinase-like domain-containing protein [Strongyloides ratti]|uniref:Protein kinase domain and Serine/threonine-/dual specificity protein kinase, catalytic domain and Protein kinase-like domain-containing protein n=1 Tax=Strongyloides ratti TaxID=34506 RepID=A0A090LED7_STRRB|nr:Protein kinase domain and Serine/threonine-/dual specificity protein kinase, catalytic domain and Protein kinase-like domain-containing protein [Strongyloides ratti]CEF68112.1 Protein kinase domain and Serine/threonine-/dual specificity protein kinase, catalytic domain and Protein kinase-like domain-containing protein [Strongyloides ratti]